jgi:hypothetical protein
MIQNVLSKMLNEGQLQAIAFTLFFAVFLFVIAYTFRLRRPIVKHLSSMPLDDSKTPSHDA